MIYVSIADIYVGKSVGHFQDGGHDTARAFTYATLCFFAGFPLSWVLDKFADWAVGQHSTGGGTDELGLGDRDPAAGPAAPQQPYATQPSLKAAAVDDGSSSLVGIPCSACPDPHCFDIESSVACCIKPQSQCCLPSTMPPSQEGEKLEQDNSSEGQCSERCKRLVHMGLLTALALGLHNMPEGLVTFVGYMDSVKSGVTTAIAIAIHNIPEGLVVASAVYFGTGNRRKALLWTSASAFAEPLGALIGLAVVCGGSLTNTVFGIMFGLVAGIMVYISIKELLPGSRSFDPRDRVSTLSVVAGMAVMAGSLIAITFSEPDQPSGTGEGVKGVAAGANGTAVSPVGSGGVR
ncbi:hypothetical protein GPECTOR_13g730 [Gonium pectorale]|uniref:Uncharacterized protein n=1 Tax=Gonium pectorale TaxID=33097 RepID=A0A150GN25_GONPE|nr:hypothetical protein GPECTOR_13g730 [Gonium pectorale]|eukprot:KXZ51243.1 hypothetical protein GPECTOR_13g730 [Gonium pectorale]